MRPFASAKRCSSAVGSAPEESMKMVGARAVVAEKMSSSVQGGVAMNSVPSAASTYRPQTAGSASSHNTCGVLYVIVLITSTPECLCLQVNTTSSSACDEAECEPLSNANSVRIAWYTDTKQYMCTDTTLDALPDLHT